MASILVVLQTRNTFHLQSLPVIESVWPPETTCKIFFSAVTWAIAAATLREPHRVARYLEATAATFHKFYDHCRVLPRGDEEITDLHRSRLKLVEASRVVFENGLELLGVSAPERM